MIARGAASGGLVALACLLCSSAVAEVHTVRVEAAEVRPNRTEPLEVVVEHDPGDRIRGHASSGALVQIAAEDDRTTFRWELPERRFPQSIQLAFWAQAQAGGRADVLVARFPLIGRTRVEASTDPGASVRVEVAGRGFGPETAGPGGRVFVAVEVPPGVTKALVVAEDDERSKGVEVALRVPALSPLLLVPLAPLAPEAPGLLWVVHPEALEPDALELRVEADGARLRPLERGDDRILYELTGHSAAGAGESGSADPLPVRARLSGVDGSEVELLWERTESADGAAPLTSTEAADPDAQRELRKSLALLLGAGSTSGAIAPSLSVGLGLEIGEVPVPLFLDLELGYRTGLEGPLESTSLHVLPLGVGLRARLLDLSGGRILPGLSLDLRLGAGALPYAWSTPTGDDSGVGGELFTGARLTVPVGGIGLLAELRASLADAGAAPVGGVWLLLGAQL